MVRMLENEVCRVRIDALDGVGHDGLAICNSSIIYGASSVALLGLARGEVEASPTIVDAGVELGVAAYI
jgi:hypothetical protein